MTFYCYPFYYQNNNNNNKIRARKYTLSKLKKDYPSPMIKDQNAKWKLVEKNSNPRFWLTRLISKNIFLGV